VSEPALQRAIANATEAPSPETVWAARTGRQATPAEYIDLAIMDELIFARFDREFADATPTEILARYQDAQADPTVLKNAAFVRAAEAKFSDRWRGRKIDANDAGELAAYETLQATFRDARTARVPASAQRALDAVRRARELRIVAEEQHGVRPVRRQR
jgi:hypothetical protein